MGRIWFVIVGALLGAMALVAGDRAQWGEPQTRNMVSSETGLPDGFEPKTGKNVKWVAPLGSQTYSTPIVAQGRVFIGTNNDKPRDPNHRGDRGILYCLSEKDGTLLWQLVVPKLPDDRYKDWTRVGICSPVTVEGDRVYTVTNRGEVVCLDIHGMANGNDGPYKDEAIHMMRAGEKPVGVTPNDADIIWLYDMPKQAGVYPHDSAHSSILIDGNYLYLNTGNGVDNTHRKIRAPEAPSLIALDKRTGKLVARDREGMGPNIVHCTWSSPALATIGGRKQIVFGGGNGVCYGFEALPQENPQAVFTKLWSYDCDPTGPKTDVHKYMGNRKVSVSNIKGMPVVHDGRVYVCAGGDIWWGKRESFLHCIDPTKRGDITKTGRIWTAPLKAQSCATPAIHDGLVYVADCGKLLHCIDAKTGKEYWSHDLKGPMWGSALVADGRVYVGSIGRWFWVFKAGREKKVLSSIRLKDKISSTPTAANGVLYVATYRNLYAIKKR